MFAQFRVRYPTGSLISELLTIYHGKYVVRVLVQIDGVAKATGLAIADTVEEAEDRARIRALDVMGINSSSQEQSDVTASVADAAEFPRLSSIFTSDRPTSADREQVSPNPKLTNTPQPNFPESTPSVPPTVATPPSLTSTTETTENSNRSANLSLENTEVVNFISPETEIEKTVPFRKVTSIASRRQDPEVTAAEAQEFSNIGLDTSSEDTASEADDLSELIARSNVEIRRLGWTKKQGSDYLQRKYGDGKKTRQDLTKEELEDFLEYLQSQPNPT